MNIVKHKKIFFVLSISSDRSLTPGSIYWYLIDHTNLKTKTNPNRINQTRYKLSVWQTRKRRRSFWEETDPKSIQHFPNSFRFIDRFGEEKNITRNRVLDRK